MDGCAEHVGQAQKKYLVKVSWDGSFGMVLFSYTLCVFGQAAVPL